MAEPTLSEKIKALRAAFERIASEQAGLEAEQTRLTEKHQAILQAAEYAQQNLPVLQKAVADAQAHTSTSQTAARDIQALQTEMGAIAAEARRVDEQLAGKQQPDGTRLGGLLASFQQEFVLIKETQKTKDQEHQALLKKVNDLLPGASSVGLAEAYKNQKESYKAGGFLWPALFVAAITAIIAIGISAFQEAVSAHTIEEATVKILARLPFYLAAVWLASFASKRQSQNKRLQQEYAHKETVSRSLEGYKREISGLKAPDGGVIMAKLMGAVVDMIRYNPSDTLDKHHGDDRSPWHTFLSILAGHWGVPVPKVAEQPDGDSKPA